MNQALTLLERVARGEPAAVQLLLDRYGSLVWSIVRRRAEPDAAEDVVQEIFVQLWKSAARYDPEKASEATFIATIARRRLIDHRRKAGRSPAVEELSEEVAAERPALDPLELSDEARLATEALMKLRPDQRRVLELSLVDGLTHTRIAEVTRLPLGTVKSHARRGLESVRALLKARRPEKANPNPSSS